MRSIHLSILFVLFLLGTGCQINQTMTFYPGYELQRTEDGWTPVRETGGTTAFVLVRTDESTVRATGFAATTTLIMHVRSFRRGELFLDPSMLKTEYTVRVGKGDGDKNVQSTRDIRGRIQVVSKEDYKIILFIDIRCELFGRIFSEGGNFIFTRWPSAPAPDYEMGMGFR